MNTFLPILPEVFLLTLGIVLLIIDPFIRKNEQRSRILGWLTVGGLLSVFILNAVFARPEVSSIVFGGMLRFDLFGFMLSELFIFTALVTALFFMEAVQLKESVESYLLLLAATIGMCLMAAASDLVMLYLAIETTSIPLYILAGFLKDDQKSTESGFKYLLFGALTSAILLYGFSLIYGFTGKTNLYDLTSFFGSFNILAVGISFLVLVGLAFKVSLFPFHFWSPDVYEGSPTPVAGFLSTASKAAGFAVVIRLLSIVFPGISSNWSMILAVLAALTMTVGNLIALAQKSVKRLLAYSSISHAGYAMIGIVAFSHLGMASTIFYLLAYVLTNLLAFGIVYLVGQKMNSDEYASYNGLSRRNPVLGLASLVAFLSLAGMPPFAGFVAKFFVFSAAIQSGWTWLAVVGVLNSIVGLYYYLNILKSVYLYRMENENEEKNPVNVAKPIMIGFVILIVGIIVAGTLFGPWFALSTTAVANIF